MFDINLGTKIFVAKNRQISYSKLNHGIWGFFHFFILQKPNPLSVNKAAKNVVRKC